MQEAAPKQTCPATGVARLELQIRASLSLTPRPPKPLGLINPAALNLKLLNPKPSSKSLNAKPYTSKPYV